MKRPKLGDCLTGIPSHGINGLWGNEKNGKGSTVKKRAAVVAVDEVHQAWGHAPIVTKISMDLG